MPVTSSVPIADVQSDFTPSSGIDNFAMVDEDIRDLDTTYNETSTQNDRDLFTFENANIPSTAVINEVLFKAYMREVTQDVNMGFSSSHDAITNHASFGLGTSYSKKTEDITGLEAWESADFDGPLKGGYYHDQMQSRAARATMMWREVRYTLGDGVTRNPGTMANDASHGTVAWIVPDNSKTSNDLYTGAVLATSAVSNYLKATNFGYTIGEIPDDFQIDGIEVYVEVNEASTGNTVVDESVRLVKGGTISGDDKSAAVVFTERDTSIKFGSPTDKWGLSWTPADIRASGFGAVFAAEHTVGAAPSLSNVDHMEIVVYASPGTGMRDEEGSTYIM